MNKKYHSLRPTTGPRGLSWDTVPNLVALLHVSSVTPDRIFDRIFPLWKPFQCADDKNLIVLLRTQCELILKISSIPIHTFLGI